MDKSLLQEGSVKRKPRELFRKTGSNVKQKLLHAKPLFPEMYCPDKIAKTNGKSLGKNKRNGTKKNSKPSQDSFIRKFLSVSNEFENENTLYAPKIYLSKRKTIDIRNMPIPWCPDFGKKTKISIDNTTKMILKNNEHILGKRNIAIKSLVNLYLYLKQCGVEYDGAKRN